MLCQLPSADLSDFCFTAARDNAASTTVAYVATALQRPSSITEDIQFRAGTSTRAISKGLLPEMANQPAMTVKTNTLIRMTNGRSSLPCSRGRWMAISECVVVRSAMKEQKLMKSIAFLLLVSFAHNSLGNEASRILKVQIHSPSLEGNLLGDSPDRQVSVYLPSSYYLEKERKYPVVYYLHGNRSSAGKVDTSKIYGVPTLELMDALIAEGRVKEMILVQADGRHGYGGCQ
jgi:hypothetical protein